MGSERLCQMSASFELLRTLAKEEETTVSNLVRRLIRVYARSRVEPKDRTNPDLKRPPQ